MGRHGISCVRVMASNYGRELLSRALGGRGMRSVEEEYKITKIKSAIKVYSNDDSTMSLVRAFEENVCNVQD